jgi:hypothetical protein
MNASHDTLAAFQAAADEVLVRHRSIVDVLTKLAEANARVGRATAKAVTVCGCISIHAERQRIPAEADLSTVRGYVSSHLEGALCERCRETLSEELGQAFFYQAALADLLGLSLTGVLTQELDRLRTLGIFNLL